VSTIGLWLQVAVEPEFFRGEVTGTIVQGRGAGFGWDAIFLPDNSTKTFGEMTPHEKGTVSHRARSSMLLQSFLDGVSRNSF
jgi:inosine/xanthosine triphosphate pyrophosphatase family protein